MAVTAKCGARAVTFNCLVDTGSQRSYVSPEISKNLNLDPREYDSIPYDVSTFLGAKRKSFRELSLEVNVADKNLCLPFLMDDAFDLNFSVDNFSLAIANIKQLGFKLAANLDPNTDHIKVHGLIGVDFLQFMSKCEVIKIMNGIAWRIPQGVIPFGDTRHFLHRNQIKPVNGNSNLNYVTIMSQAPTVPNTQINFVLDPIQSYSDPLADIFTESQVERNIDKMFSCESLGLPDNGDTVSDYDSQKIAEFERSISFREGAYHVKLPWHEDKLAEVPSNEHVALAVLDRVVHKLEKDHMLSQYREVFEQQESEGIIERIAVDPKDFKNYVWIPHRPVFKSDAQTTTKIRPVYNCSLKTKGGNSLNEASYPGVNLMSDMLELLLMFRTNKYAMLADIRKAFLMIKLSHVEDRNRFCFFMKQGTQLICYRFTTIIFGFNASPFILNFVLKHHARKFPLDECTRMLLNNFYVDNLIKTSNESSVLSNLYKESVVRMNQGNFALRSWNTNCEELKQELLDDQNLVEHGCDLEKVLGYNYSTSHDTMHIANITINSAANTKRGVLSETSKVFDPLSLCLPVTIRGRTLLRDLWSQKLDWDVPINSENQTQWKTLAKDLAQLHKFEFPRFCIDEEIPSQLFIFCDASKLAYGFSAYSVQNGKSNLIFAKAKVAPMTSRSLPTLELMSVYLAVKCLPVLLSTYAKVKFLNVTIAGDAQVVLSWLLSSDIKTKNLFTRNRLQDIRQMNQGLRDKYNVNIQYKYIPTDQNPADLLTRGLTYEKFQLNLNFWLFGPAWLSNDPVVWPSSDLNCISSEHKSILRSTAVNCSVQADPEPPIVPFRQFSSLAKLLNVTTVLFKVRNVARRVKGLDQLDPHRGAFLHLIGKMQNECFSEELTYLQNPQGRAPDLVKNLNLFLDNEGSIRSRGRIGKNTLFEYEVINPILVGKKHPLTALIINDCHLKVKHLGLQATLNKVRLSGFWIPKARQAVKNVISHCIMCQRFNSLAFKYPKMTNLPKHRVNMVKPFSHTGVDYTGHLWVKNDKGVSKMYILVFTCLNIRAIHIELVNDMSTHSFILALLRFTNTYGIPSHIYSDNAKSFIAGCNLIEEVFACSEFKEKFEIYNIKHIRIPVYSAWVGSTWERMIRVVKSCLYKMIGRSRMQYFDLLTLLSDIQNAVNSRPLTYRCSSDAADLEVITPNSFLKPNVNAGVMLKLEDRDIFRSDPVSQADVISSIETRNAMLNKFRELWYESYLLGLREQCRDLHEIEFVNRIKVGDVVLIRNPIKPRPFWQLGRVLELIMGDDHKVRSVKLKRGDGSVQVHSINLLYPMELSLTHSHQTTEVITDVDGPEIDSDHNSNAQVASAENPAIHIPVSDETASNSDGQITANQPSTSTALPQRPQRTVTARGKRRSDDTYYYY